jgi:hypothetical protein
MKTIRSCCISLAALLLVTLVGHTQTVIHSLPYTIIASGNYVLGANLSYWPPGFTGAITVNQSNVTIDLNGHYISNLVANAVFAIYATTRLT